jgi:hypothetical protein
LLSKAFLTTPAWLSHVVERCLRLNDGLAALPTLFQVV